MRPLLALRAMVCCFGLGSILVIGSGGCQDSNDCPATGQIKPGAACGTTDMQCAYDVPQTACDGTETTVASSCFCTNGTWSCPDEWKCETSGDDAGDETSDEVGDDAGGDAEQDAADDSPSDTPIDSPAAETADAAGDADG